MSLVKQQGPFEGPNEKSQKAAAVAERNQDLATEQSTNDSATFVEEDPLQILVDADDEQCLIEEAVLLNTREAKTKEVIIEPPTIPKRNTLRTSRLLDSLRLDSIESATKSLNTTDNAYLSSEEEASSTADDDLDYDYESSSEESEKSSVSRKSQEVTARAVSVVFVGKPSMIHLANNRSPVSPPKRPQSEFFGRAVSSSFGTASLRNRPEHRKASLASIRDLPSESPSFLNQDPFRDNPYTRRESLPTIEAAPSSGPVPRLSRTPSTAFHRLSKTISLARKRSRPNLKAVANSPSTSTLNLPGLNTVQETGGITAKADIISPAGSTTPQTPVTYNEVVRAARRGSVVSPNTTQPPPPPALARPPSPISPLPAKRSLLGGLAMNRRRSMRIKS
ncbi:hypothetical protein GGS20DRAFT_174501 [Poronia punctata]|nr:hypothetical protein GGS20DRAFT_174501 [Poronia punctata]